MAGLARGKIIYGDASGNPAALAVGSANYVLTSDGTDISWASSTGTITALNNATANELVTVGSTTTELDAESALTFDGSDLKLLEAVNNGNPSISVGGADAERLLIQSVFDSGAQTLDYVEFSTAAASGTANKGKFIFFIL